MTIIRLGIGWAEMGSLWAQFGHSQKRGFYDRRREVMERPVRQRPDLASRSPLRVSALPDLRAEPMIYRMPQEPLRFVAAIVLLLGVCARTQAGEHSTMSKSGSDGRQPLPLLGTMADHQKQNMREHLAAVQAIIAAIRRDDMDAVGKAVARIGYSEAMGRMCEHMGAAAPGFTTMALDFHRTADTIGEAARHGDRVGVLSALDRTLQRCVACHAAYRQEVVDEDTWRRLTAPSATH